MISVNFLVAVAEPALPSPNVLILSALLAVVMALLGLAVFYGLERAAKVSRQRNRKAGKEDVTEAGIF